VQIEAQAKIQEQALAGMRTAAQLKAEADLDDILNSSPRKETNLTTDLSLRDLRQPRVEDRSSGRT
jgi:hypothetical protein